MNPSGHFTNPVHHGSPGGGGLPSSGMGNGSLHSSMESVAAEDSPPPALSARQDPPGQEHPAAEPLPRNSKTQWEGACHHGDCLGNRLQLMSLVQCRVMTSATKGLREDHSPFPSAPAVFHAHQHIPEFHQCNRYDPPGLSSKAHFLPPVPPAMRPMVPPSVAVSGPAGGWEPAVPRHGQMEVLFWENERLKRELDTQQDISFRIQKLEQELRRISGAYSQLIQTCADREAEENQQREQLLEEIKRLQQLNIDLQDRLEETSRQAVEEVEIADRHQHQMMALITQNELQQQEQACLQRHLRQLRVRWHELRVHAFAAERALGASERRAGELRRELRTQQACAHTAQQLQGALSRLQDACARREELDTELRAQLQQQQLRHTEQSDSSSLTNDQPDPDMESRLAVMTALVHQKDEVIRHLQQRLREALKSVADSKHSQSILSTEAETPESEEQRAQCSSSTLSSPQPTTAAASSHHQTQALTTASSHHQTQALTTASSHHQTQALTTASSSSCHLSVAPSTSNPVPCTSPEQASVDCVKQLTARPPERLEGLDGLEVEAVEVFI
ncbi:angiomotin-like 2a [Sardina pilchardus]|uniref:angiomotin-like 2a n=1 Tax=Sardina pilchardus TaxID=27697 RepID=UPI002E0FCFBA